MNEKSNTKRILTWGIFILIVGLITWGMIVAGKKAEKESANIATVDKVVASDVFKGSSTAPVVIIEYSDFQCPACAAYFPLIDKVVEENKTLVQFVYRHFPLAQHGNAVPAALSAEAAGKQGKFWEMYALLFTNQKNWEESKTAEIIFENYAKDLKLDMVKYAEDLKSKELMDKVNNDQKSGVRAGVNSTPTFYVNGKKIVNPKSNEEFKKLIEDAAKSVTNP